MGKSTISMAIFNSYLRSWIVWFQESSEFASGSDTFSYEQCPVEPLLAYGASSPHLKDSGTDQLAKTMTFVFLPMAYSYIYTISEDDMMYPLVNKQLDPENHQFLMETNLPSPICQGLC